MLTQEEIDRMFEEIGLGDEASRERFAELANSLVRSQSQSRKSSFALRLTRSNRRKIMLNWDEILREIQSSGSTHDVIRRKYLLRLQAVRVGNIIAYSRMLQKPGLAGTELNDGDKNGFMNAIHDLERTKDRYDSSYSGR